MKQKRRVSAFPQTLRTAQVHMQVECPIKNAVVDPYASAPSADDKEPRITPSATLSWCRNKGHSSDMRISFRAFALSTCLLEIYLDTSHTSFASVIVLLTTCSIVIQNSDTTIMNEWLKSI